MASNRWLSSLFCPPFHLGPTAWITFLHGSCPDPDTYTKPAVSSSRPRMKSSQSFWISGPPTVRESTFVQNITTLTKDRVVISWISIRECLQIGKLKDDMYSWSNLSKCLRLVRVWHMVPASLWVKQVLPFVSPSKIWAGHNWTNHQ